MSRINRISGEEFKALYMQLGMNVKQVADFLCVCESTVSFWQNNKRKIPVAVAKLLLSELLNRRGVLVDALTVDLQLVSKYTSQMIID